ncbi:MULTISPECIES: hypothetical protein [Candidatus Nitrosocaldus]|jgi:hypothetical protein|uniref:Uncharacterized protein n=1 Tax=Candidatus Nitrosocaldus cavascurensis TaxID=2058097 RepID=A0A2K5AQF5_9ARCH|nr:MULTISPECIES: hypothetical protein [Candidatus Nitrosocaldus]SPC33870.1 protein of unknown function [Candidatus Nitrosocaldus cavascurensis]
MARSKNYLPRISIQVPIEIKDLIGNTIRENIRAKTPVKTGALRTSIRYEIKDNLLEFYALQYLIFLDRGTKKHSIKIARAKALHWIDEVTGENRFSRVHEVDGIKPFHIIDEVEIARVAKDTLIKNLKYLIKIE